MDSLLILRDAERRPRLFWWNGAIEETALDTWLRRGPLYGRCPPDLRALWLRTGGGDVFETETIYGPSSGAAVEQGVLEANAAFRSRGLPDRYVVFANTCAGLGAVDCVEPGLVQLAHRDFSVDRRFADLNAWYMSTIRREFAARYGLDEIGGDHAA